PHFIIASNYLLTFWLREPGLRFKIRNVFRILNLKPSASRKRPVALRHQPQPHLSADDRDENLI
ncbi:MAG: hypothetical protein ABW138_21845, partial [Candidatus Thiodiazotropha sp. 4PDIVS1]